MISLPYNMPLMSQIMPSQNVPVQTSQNHFQTFQQPQMVAQQMQTNPAIPFSTNLQDTFKQPFYGLHQADVFLTNHQYAPNVIPTRAPCPPFFQTPPNIPPPMQTPQNCGPLPQNIFILPPSCHRSSNQQQQPDPTNQGGVIHQTGPSTGFNCPQSICYPPSFYPYPIPMPVFEPFGAQVRGKEGSRGCAFCCKRQDSLDRNNYSPRCCCNIREPEEHRCTASNDDTVCSKRNCPASISLQALASQLLSLPGIISCAVTRLILRKVPGSNITSTMEDTMDKAQKSISALTKDQLLAESRNAQQVNALINLHMTTTPPANVVPLLTLLQLKVNVLKAQVESLINKKVMECQGYGYEVETSDPIDPTVLTMKTNAELRQLLSALRQKECDERVNTNFSPYHSQRVIAEARLNNVQAKIRQVEAEFDRRRCVSVPTPTLTSRVIRQFSESRCTFGFAHANLFEPYVQGSTLDSPDPFVQSICNPKRLYLKPREAGQDPWPRKDRNKPVATSEDGTSMCKDTGTGEGTVDSSKEKAVESKSSVGNCSCMGTSSEESFEEDKKKLRIRNDRSVTVGTRNASILTGVSLLEMTYNAITRIEDTSQEGSEEREIKAEEIDNGSVERKETKKRKATVDERVKGDDEETAVPEDKLRVIREEDTDSEKSDESVIKEDDTDSDESDGPLIKEEDTDSDKSDGLVISKEKDDDAKAGTKDTEIVRIKSETDSGKQAMVGKEPESPKKILTLGSGEFRIKKEPEDDNEDDKKRSRVKPLEFVEVEEEISDNAILVTKKSAVIDVDDSDDSETVFTAELGNVEKSKNVGVQNETNLRNAEESKEKSTRKNVSKDKKPESKASGKDRTYQEPQTSDTRDGMNFEIQPTSSTEKGTKEQQTANEVDSNVKVNPEVENSPDKKNVHFVSMMTLVEYDRRCVGFRGWNINGCGNSVTDGEREDRRKKDGKDEKDSSGGHIEKIDATDESSEDLLSEKKNASTVSTSQQCEEEENAFSDKVFTKNRRIKDERTANGTRSFPPLKYATPKTTGTTATGISENIFHEKGIESDSLNTVCDRSTSYHCDSETGNSIVSVIYSTIENQIISASSFLANIRNLRSVIPNFHFNELLRNKNEKALFKRHTVKNSRNKNVINRTDDWIFLPSDTNARNVDEYRTSGENRISISETYNGIRKLRHSIIEDKETRKYLLITGSSSDQLRELSRNGFERPYQTRRSLVIRSRPKDPGHSKPERLAPFVILKRPTANKIFVSRAKKRAVRELKNGGKLLTLSEITKDNRGVENGC